LPVVGLLKSPCGASNANQRVRVTGLLKAKFHA
jgi:hypothetical protein